MALEQPLDVGDVLGVAAVRDLHAVQGHALGSAEYAVGAGLDSAVPVVSEGAVLLNQQLSGGN